MDDGPEAILDQWERSVVAAKARRVRWTAVAWAAALTLVVLLLP